MSRILFRWRVSPRVLLPLALAGLLGVLAALQHSWLGQLSDAERERLRTSLEARAGQFTLDIDREVTRAYLLFQLDSDSLDRRDFSGFAARWDRWNATAAYPRMVSEIYLSEPAGRETSGTTSQPPPAPDPRPTLDSTAPTPPGLPDPRSTPPSPVAFEFRATLEPRAGGGRDAPAAPSGSVDPMPTLLRFDPAARGFVPAEWPPDLLPVADEIASQSVGGRLAPIGGWTPAGAAVPALLAPLAGLRIVRAESGAVIASAPPFRRGHVIIRFDVAYLRDVLLPSLARRHFATDNLFDYHVSIAARPPPGIVLYHTGAIPASAPGDGPDLKRPLFDVRPTELEALRLQGPVEHAPGADVVHQERMVVSVFRSKTAGHAAAIEDGLWEMSLWHRAGSLEAAVAAARRRNLALSSAILLLLAVALALIVVSTERARRLAAQQMEFVAGVSHELRTPLSVIRSAGENLADGVVDNEEQVRRYGSLVAAEGRKLSEMVEQVMAYAGLETGRPLLRHPVVVADIVDRAIDGCAERTEAPALRIERRIEDNLPAVAGDAAALVRAVGNLVSNAVRHGGRGGWVRVLARAGREAGRPVVGIRVEDGGPGVDPAERERIFEPFYRGRTALEGQVRGSGLGLSLVRRVVQTHGGRIEVENAPGGGAAFTLTLPAAAPGGSRTADGAESTADTGIAAGTDTTAGDVALEHAPAEAPGARLPRHGDSGQRPDGSPVRP